MSTVQSLTPVWLCDPMDILQHARLPCPSPTPGSCSNTCPLSHWCHPTISSSVVPFSSRLQSFLTSGSFLMSQFFASGGQSRPKYWSFSFNINPSNEYSGLISFRIDWVNLLEVQGTLESSATPQFKSINSLALSFLYSPTLISINDYWKKKSIAVTWWTFVGKVGKVFAF